MGSGPRCRQASGVTIALLGAAIVALLASDAHADDFLDDIEFPRKYALGIEVHGGLATPLGFAGLVLDGQYKALSLTVGAGRGISGTQLSIMARAEPIRFRPYWRGHNRRVGIYLGAGISRGPHENSGFFSEYRASWDAAYWASGEIGAQSRFVSGLTIRAYVGMGWIINRDSAVYTCSILCDVLIPDEEVYTSLPYAGVAVGYDFL